jgi:hypothetical protein
LIHRWQPLAIVVAVSLTIGAGITSAQTVIVKGVPGGAPTELVMNGTAVASAAANAEGLATLTVPQSGTAVPAQTEEHLFVDRCGELFRILMVEGALAPAASAGACARQPVQGYFIVRRVTTFVIDVSGNTPLLWLTQGRAPESWLAPGPIPASVGSTLGSQTGLVVFGNAGLALFSGLSSVACGTVTDCTSDTKQRVYGGGVAYWLSPFFAVEGQYAAPGKATAEGSGTAYRFNTSLDVRMVTLGGLVGGPVGRGRLYGRAGVNRLRAIMLTTQTVDDTSVVVGDETQTIPGASQTLELRTAGWGYVFGGGFEVWMSRWMAISGDLNRVQIRGRTEDASQREINNGVWLAQVGVRVRIGR